MVGLQDPLAHGGFSRRLDHVLNLTTSLVICSQSWGTACGECRKNSPLNGGAHVQTWARRWGHMVPERTGQEGHPVEDGLLFCLLAGALFAQGSGIGAGPRRVSCEIAAQATEEEVCCRQDAGGPRGHDVDWEKGRAGDRLSAGPRGGGGPSSTTMRKVNRQMAASPPTPQCTKRPPEEQLGGGGKRIHQSESDAANAQENAEALKVQKEQLHDLMFNGHAGRWPSCRR